MKLHASHWPLTRQRWRRISTPVPMIYISPWNSTSSIPIQVPVLFICTLPKFRLGKQYERAKYEKSGPLPCQVHTVSIHQFPYSLHTVNIRCPYSVHTPNQRHLYGPLFQVDTYSLRLHFNKNKNTGDHRHSLHTGPNNWVNRVRHPGGGHTPVSIHQCPYSVHTVSIHLTRDIYPVSPRPVHSARSLQRASAT